MHAPALSKVHFEAPARMRPPSGTGRAKRLLSLDDLDGAILRELILGDKDLFRTDRMSLEQIARDLHIRRNTVALRIRRMSAAGVFLPLSLGVEPTQLGLVRATLWVVPRPELRNEATLRALYMLDGVQLIIQYIEGWIIIFYTEDEEALEARRELIAHLCGATETFWDSMSSQDYAKRPPIRLTSTDLGILRLLLLNARTPFPRIAKELGTSARTVQRRVRYLTSHGAIMVVPTGKAKTAGLVFGYLRTYFTAGTTPREEIIHTIDSMLSRAVFRNLHHAKFASWIVGVPSLGDLDALLGLIRSVPQVKSVTVRIMISLRLNPLWSSWLLRVLRRRFAPDGSPVPMRKGPVNALEAKPPVRRAAPPSARRRAPGGRRARADA